jgi:glycosyltransferase involved in cell wall biosynthesis
MIYSQRGLLLVANSVHNTSRVFKIARFLTEKKRVGSLTIIGFWSEGLSNNEAYTDDVKIIRIKTLKQLLDINNLGGIPNKILTLLSVIPFFFKYFIACYRVAPQVIYCHDVVMLPSALLLKFFYRADLIYMPHELETEETGRSHIINKILKLIEKIGVRYSKSITVVSPSIQEWYQHQYKTDKVFLIRNIPDFQYDSNVQKKLRSTLSLSSDDIVFIYQGLIEKTRGIIEVATIFSQLQDKKKHIVFMGYGPDANSIIDISTRNKNVHYLSAVDPRDIINYSSDADIGVVFIDQNISTSYKYSLPNKYFEYVKSGIPVLISDNLVSLKNEIDKSKTGWSIDSKIKSLFEFIEGINQNDIIEAKKKVLSANSGYSWNREVSILLDF